MANVKRGDNVQFPKRGKQTKLYRSYDNWKTANPVMYSDDWITKWYRKIEFAGNSIVNRRNLLNQNILNEFNARERKMWKKKLINLKSMKNQYVI